MIDVDPMETGPAAYAVWEYLRHRPDVTIQRHQGQMGYTMTNGIQEAVSELWPLDANTNTVARLRNTLKNAENVVCLRPRRLHSDGLWWVSETWHPVQGFEPNTVDDTQVEPTEDESTADDQSESIGANIAAQITTTIEGLQQEIKHLRTENDQLRFSLGQFKKSIGGMWSFVEDWDV